MQAFFYKLFAEAKEAVPEPPQPKLKLKMSSAPEAVPKITLRMGGKGSPSESPVPPVLVNGTTATIENIQNGVGPRRNPFSGSQISSTPLPSIGQLEQAQLSGSAASPSPSVPSLVKNEDGSKPSPPVTLTPANLSQNNHSTSTNGAPNLHINGNSMLPPTDISGHSPSITNIVTQPQSYAPHFSHQVPNPSFESKWRSEGKGKCRHLVVFL